MKIRMKRILFWIACLLVSIYLSEGCINRRKELPLFLYSDMQLIFNQYLTLSDSICRRFNPLNDSTRSLCCITARVSGDDTLIGVYRGFGLHKWLPPENMPQDTPLPIDKKGSCLQQGTICYVEYEDSLGKGMRELIQERILQTYDAPSKIGHWLRSDEEANTMYLTYLLFKVHRPNKIEIIDDGRGLNRKHNEKYCIQYTNRGPQLILIHMDKKGSYTY